MKQYLSNHANTPGAGYINAFLSRIVYGVNFFPTQCRRTVSMMWKICGIIHFLKFQPEVTKNSAVADKPRDAFVEMQWRGWPAKTRPSPYLLPCRIWSFWVKGCTATPKLGSSGTPLSCDERRGWPQDALPSPNVTTSNLAVLRQRVCA